MKKQGAARLKQRKSIVLKRKKNESLGDYVTRAIQMVHKLGCDAMFNYEGEWFVFLPINAKKDDLSKLDLRVCKLLIKEAGLRDIANNLVQEADRLREQASAIGATVKSLYPKHNFLFSRTLG